MYDEFDDHGAPVPPEPLRWGWQEAAAILLGLLGVVAFYYTLAAITVPIVAHLE